MNSTKIEIVGGDMKVSEIIKTAILSSDKQQKEVAEKMGWSPQSFANNLGISTFSTSWSGKLSMSAP